MNQHDVITEPQFQRCETRFGGGELLGTRQSGETPFRVADPEQIQRLLPIAHDDARLLIERDGGLTHTRGEAARVMLYLFERDWGVQLLRGG